MHQRSPHKFNVGDLIENIESKVLGLVVDKTDFDVRAIKSYFRVWWLNEGMGYRVSLVNPRDTRVKLISRGKIKQ
jgi:hypothetical protein